MRTQPHFFKTLLFGILMLAYSTCSVAATPQDRTGDSSGGSADTGIDSGGIISESEVLCGPNPAQTIKNESSPSGEIIGFLIIKWEYRLAGGVWTDIPGENMLTFSPGYITERTEFRRGCKEEADQPWIYSNIIIKDVVPAIVDVKVMTIDVTCKFGEDGYATAQVMGGTPGYFFDWSNGHSGGSVFDFTAGAYNLTVTDQNGCTYTTSDFEINEPETIVTAYETGNIQTLCPGSSDGALMVDAYYGDAPYSFIWSNGETTSSNYDLPAGTYDVTVTDAKGCSNTLTGLTVDEPPRFKVTGNEEAASCFGSSDGEVEIEISGGTPPYLHIWNDGETAAFRDKLSPGIYEVAILDSKGCSFAKTIEISQPNPLLVSPYIVNNIICKASINIVPQGGTSPYTYEWNNGETDSYLSNLCPGNYTLTTTDANGCVNTELLSISADFAIEAIQIEMILNPYSETDEIVIKVPYKTEVFIEVYTTTGQLVESYTNLTPSEDKEIHLKLDLAKFSNGMYLIRVEQNGLSASDNIILAN